LRWFWFDGLFASASDAIVASYLSLFVLALGGTRAQIGLMSSLSSLGAALLLFPGAAIVERWGRRKQMVLLGGGGVARAALLLMGLVPLAFAGPAVVYVAIGLAVVRDAFANFSMPAWMAITADIVPLSWRGRYFSSRNVAMGVANILVTYLVGQLITGVGGPAGYQFAMGLAATVGLAATFSFARIDEPLASMSLQGNDQSPRAPSLSGLLQDLRRCPEFLALCAAAALWNFSLAIAGPFFSIYLVESLQASASVVGTLSVVSSLAALPGQRLFGPLVDRWGPRRIQLISGFLIPLVPWAWLLVRSPWHVVPINLVSGFVWAGYGLASFSFLLTLIPERRRPRYSALYQVVVLAALAGGAIFGGIIAERWGYKAIFVLSGLGRLSAALLFARFVRPPVAAVSSGGGEGAPEG
jgi:MFS family permease